MITRIVLLILVALGAWDLPCRWLGTRDCARPPARVLHQRADIAKAEPDLHAIWQPDEAWSRFIQNQLEGGQ